VVEFDGELHTTCRILRSQEISPSRSLINRPVIFSWLSLSVCVSEGVASWGNRGGYVSGKPPLNLFL
jgi:hypothetical protein